MKRQLETTCDPSHPSYENWQIRYSLLPKYFPTELCDIIMNYHEKCVVKNCKNGDTSYYCENNQERMCREHYYKALDDTYPHRCTHCYGPCHTCGEIGEIKK